jgi:organic radical activating enzyme
MALTLPHNKFCVLPWVSLEATPVGSVRPCCLADDEITNDAGEKYSLLNIDLEEVRNSSYMTNLRKQFLNEEQPALCRRCWSVEDAGGTSKRMHTLDRLESLLDQETTWTEDAKDLMFIDFKLGNICNLKCRICGSWSSSTYAVEDLKQLPKEERKSSYYYNLLRLGEWPRKSENFWQEIEEQVDDIRYLEFTGGEPFMIREHFEFLRGLVERGIAHQVEIHYNTNGTQWPEQYVDVWKHFKHVEIAFSIDNVEKRFEYERTEAKWDEVNANVERFINLRNTSKNISLQLCCTINIYNVLYLSDVVDWKYFTEFNFVFWNILHDGPEWCVQALPEVAKQEAQSRLHTADVEDAIKQQWTNVIKFMNESNGITLEQLQSAIKRIDDRRGVSLRDTHSELFQLIYG